MINTLRHPSFNIFLSYPAAHGALRMVITSPSISLKIGVISHKRFVGSGKPVGHAQKVLSILNKNEAAASSLSFTPPVSKESLDNQPSSGLNSVKTRLEAPSTSSPLGKGPSTVGNTGGISSIKNKIYPGAQAGSHSIFDSFRKLKDPTFEVESSLPSPLSPQIPSTIKPEFRGEFEKALESANKDDNALFQALSKRYLFDLDKSKVKSAFYKQLLENPNTPKEYVILSKADFKDPVITIGLLRVDENTIILSGKQLHPIVLYTSPDNKNIAWSYLTSENDSQTTELSTYQPFSDKITKQFLRIIKPFLVKGADIEPLPADQDAKGKLYLKEPAVKEILEEKACETLGSPQVLETYTGLGFVKEDLIAGLAYYELDQIKEAEQFFTNYKSYQNTFSAARLKDWLKERATINPHSYKYLIKLIQQYENK